jgi:hypothetical protein
MHFRTKLKYGGEDGGWTAKKTMEHEDYTPPLSLLLSCLVEVPSIGGSIFACFVFPVYLE